MTTDVASFAIAFGKRIITQLLHWFEDIFAAVGMTELWIGAVVFAAVFSIVIVPLRGGADLTNGALGGFLMNKVNRHKRNDD